MKFMVFFRNSLLSLCLALLASAASLAAKPAATATASLTAKESEQLQRLAELALRQLPSPRAVVHTEGQLPSAAGYQQAVQAKADWSAMLALASAYAVVHAADPASAAAVRFRDGYALVLSRWLDVYRISGNPIDETGLGQWLLAFRVAGDALDLPLQQRMRSFACALSERYQQSTPRHKSTSSNNWQSHRVKLAVIGAFTCAAPGLVSGALELFKAQIQQNLLPTGESIDFKQRDALHYVIYSLEPLVEAALFASFYDVPLYAYAAPQSQSLERSLQWLLPYVNGERKHEEFVHSTVAFDKARAAAGVAGFTGVFKPEKAKQLYWLAAQLDNPRWAATSQALGVAPLAVRAAWLVR